MKEMFEGATSFDQDLGWCVDEDVDLDEAFDNTPCESTSCGVKQVQGGCAPTPAPMPAPTVTPRTSSSSGGGDDGIALIAGVAAAAALLLAIGAFCCYRRRMGPKPKEGRAALEEATPTKEVV